MAKDYSYFKQLSTEHLSRKSYPLLLISISNSFPRRINWFRMLCLNKTNIRIQVSYLVASFHELDAILVCIVTNS